MVTTMRSMGVALLGLCMAACGSSDGGGQEFDGGNGDCSAGEIGHCGSSNSTHDDRTACEEAGLIWECVPTPDFSGCSTGEVEGCSQPTITTREECEEAGHSWDCIDSTDCTQTCESESATCGEVCGAACGVCADGETCSTDRACVEAPAVDCAKDGCPAGDVCNQETGLCETPSGTGDACTSCSDDAGCPGGWSCIALSSGKVCLEPCNSNDVCETGWSCIGSPTYCTPDKYSCSGCVASGCPDGQTCNSDLDECTTPTAVCQSCTENWQCGANAACIKEADGGRVCKPRCTLGGAAGCAESATCGLDSETSLSVCSYTSDACCYDTTAVCGSGVTCSGATPVLLDGECVQCANNDDCAGSGVCNQANHTCESADCTGDTPYMVDGECVECLSNDNCPAGWNCNTDSHACTSPDDECGQCNTDYPVCLELQGDIYCVQCTEDSHCDAGCTCDTQLYACSGDCVVAGAEQCGADTGETCPADLVCENSLCIDPTGACDGVTVMCPGGNQCVSLLELLMGGGGGGLPLPPGSGGGIPGVCGCTPGTNDCASGIPCTELAGGGGACINCDPMAIISGGMEQVLICAFLGL